MRKQMTEDESRDFIVKVNEAFDSELVLEGLLYAKDEKRDAKKIFLFTGSHLPNVPVEWVGQHFGAISETGEISLSIEGAQAVGRTAKKMVSISRDDVESLFAGKDLEINKADGLYILKSGEYILCAGKIVDKKLINPTTKSRRTRQQYQRED